MNGDVIEIVDSIEDEKWLDLDPIHLEFRIEPTRPDIVAYIGQDAFVIEVSVANPLSTKRRDRISALQIPAIEVDLVGVSYSISQADLMAHVIDQVAKKKWIWHPAWERLKSSVQQRLRHAIGEKNRQIEEQDRISRELLRASQALQQRQHRPRPQRSAPITSDHIGPLWLRCESCRHVWQTPRDAALGKAHINCEACGLPVSTSAPLRLRRP